MMIQNCGCLSPTSTWKRSLRTWPTSLRRPEGCSTPRNIVHSMDNGPGCQPVHGWQQTVERLSCAVSIGDVLTVISADQMSSLRQRNFHPNDNPLQPSSICAPRLPHQCAPWLPHQCAPRLPHQCAPCFSIPPPVKQRHPACHPWHPQPPLHPLSPFTPLAPPPL